MQPSHAVQAEISSHAARTGKEWRDTGALTAQRDTRATGTLT